MLQFIQCVAASLCYQSPLHTLDAFTHSCVVSSVSDMFRMQHLAKKEQFTITATV